MLSSSILGFQWSGVPLLERDVMPGWVTFYCLRKDCCIDALLYNTQTALCYKKCHDIIALMQHYRLLTVCWTKGYGFTRMCLFNIYDNGYSDEICCKITTYNWSLTLSITPIDYTHPALWVWYSNWPPLQGDLWLECCARQAWITSILPSSRCMGKLTLSTKLQGRITLSIPSTSWRRLFSGSFCSLGSVSAIFSETSLVA